MHDAAADRRAKLKPDFVKSLKQCRFPGNPEQIV
jgi:transcriptional regulator of acetoin/glycerol metabolism